MLKTLSLFLLLLAVIKGHAQQATVINIIPGAPKGADLRFPLVSLPDKAIARKINDYLQTNILQQTTLKAPGRQVFDKVKWTEKQSGYDELGYTVHANNGRLLCIGFECDWMSAYPNPYEQYFVFNSQNGEIIFPEDIFTPQGLKELTEEVKRKRSALINAHLKELKSNPDAADDLENIKSSFASCNGDAQLDAFYTTGAGIVFHKSSCLPHVIQALDANLDITYSFGQLQSHFSAFGQKLFNTAKQDISKDSFPSLSKPLHGKIDNKYDIVMQLHFNGDHSVSGFYYYNNYQSAIELSGKLENGLLKLTEHDKDYNDTAVFEATVSGTMLSGNWTNLKTKKVLEFVVKN
jgi:hypothetical protein